MADRERFIALYPQGLQNASGQTFWDGCTTDPVIFSQMADMTAMQWTNCQGDVTIFHYRMEGEKHIWPKTLGNFPTDETIWQFFLAYPLPQNAPF